MCSLTPSRWHLPLLQELIIGHTLEREEAPLETAPVRALHAYPPFGVQLPMKSITVFALGLEVLVLCLGSRAFDPRTVRCLVDESALAVTCHGHLLPVCGLVAPGHSLLIATGAVECARCLDDCARDQLAVARPGMTARSHLGPATSHMTVTGLVTALLLLTARGLGRRVGGLDGVAGIARQLLVLPAIAATLG